MKKILIAYALLITPILASDEHLLFKAGILSSPHIDAPPLATLGFSSHKIMPEKNFFSGFENSLEFGISAPDEMDLTAIYGSHFEFLATTRALGLHYFNKASNNKFFIGIGLYAEISKYRRYLPKWSISEDLTLTVEKDKILDLDFTKMTAGPSISIGINVPNKKIPGNIILFTLGYDQPLIGDSTGFNPIDIGRFYISVSADLY